MKRKILIFIGNQILKNQKKVKQALQPEQVATLETRPMRIPQHEDLEYTVTTCYKERTKEVVSTKNIGDGDEGTWSPKNVQKRDKKVNKLKKKIQFWRKVGNVAVRALCSKGEQEGLKRLKCIAGNALLYDGSPIDNPVKKAKDLRFVIFNDKPDSQNLSKSS